jgi:hypothetical protein
MTGRTSKVKKDQNIEKAIRMSKIKKIGTKTNWSERWKWPTYGVWPS